MLIAFDGIDGSGKSTMAQKSLVLFQSLGYDAELFDMGSCGFIDEYISMIKEPKKKVPSEIRELLYYFEGNLFSDYVKENKDKIILIDRYYLSYYAYGPINGVSQEKVEALVKNMIEPDMYFYMDVSPECAVKRILSYRKIDNPEIGYKNELSNNEESNIQKYIAVQTKIKENYNRAFQMCDNLFFINASKSVESIMQEITEKITLFLSKKGEN